MAKEARRADAQAAGLNSTAITETPTALLRGTASLQARAADAMEGAKHRRTEAGIFLLSFLPETGSIHPLHPWRRKTLAAITNRVPLDTGRRFSESIVMAKKSTAIKDRYSKTQILEQIAATTGLTRKQVGSVLDSLTDVIEGHLKKNAVGEFVLPGLMKISTVRKPAVKARKGISPFTKEEVVFKAKPASTVVKVRPLKKLKDMAV